MYAFVLYVISISSINNQFFNSSFWLCEPQKLKSTFSHLTFYKSMHVSKCLVQISACLPKVYQKSIMSSSLRAQTWRGVDNKLLQLHVTKSVFLEYMSPEFSYL